ncbi:MAG: PAN domain-containing protein [Sphingopyxis sp.]|uniref:PAN domain-containing protein n=1 Tax=Sphingopyxis sp. TaxID=1908224 RepID=UPI002ABAFCA3|nr:PAN domain-containing protein [Sphingopyxis sp.]MDZ3832247.1 PAN domain-containing protein [Sphingopyxis sp.]
MTRSKLFLVALAALAAGGSATLLAKNSDPQASLTLYNGENMMGEGVTVTRNVANFQSVPAQEGFDGTANDFAYSVRSVGRWQLCMDAGFKTDCITVDGELAALGERGGSISSARYIGPSKQPQTNASATPSPAPSSRPQALPQAQAAEWQPMYNVDLFGNDYREIVYDRPGNSWQSCKASCDGDRKCQAWTYVAPGRTPNGECFLKAPVPAASTSDCCISGVKGADSSRGRRGDAAINLGLGRVGDTAKRAAEDEVNNAVDRKVRGAVGRILGN